MSRLERLNRRYRAHHRTRQDFVYGGSERARLLRGLVGGPGKHVLDLGCRTGALTQHYVDGNDVVGVDVDQSALDAARERLGIEVAWADVEEHLPFDDASFDVVVAGELLEHLEDPAAAIGHSLRVLKPGGSFVGSVPNAYRLKNRVRFLLGGRPDYDPMHLHMYAPGDLQRLLEGFETAEIQFAVGRFRRLHPRLLANTQVFSARKPR
ncbi:MAG: hypothetical protein QOF43_1728 [Gaiellaceae bacterium]|jgi:SAM-dependent methyltransferase|nr:hypothetical protein [Gaiellaceae bacterium]